MCERNIGEDVANLTAGEVDVIINTADTTIYDVRYIRRLDEQYFTFSRLIFTSLGIRVMQINSDFRAMKFQLCFFLIRTLCKKSVNAVTYNTRSKVLSSL